MLESLRSRKWVREFTIAAACIGAGAATASWYYTRTLDLTVAKHEFTVEKYEAKIAALELSLRQEVLADNAEVLESTATPPDGSKPPLKTTETVHCESLDLQLTIDPKKSDGKTWDISRDGKGAPDPEGSIVVSTGSRRDYESIVRRSNAFRFTAHLFKKNGLMIVPELSQFRVSLIDEDLKEDDSIDHVISQYPGGARWQEYGVAGRVRAEFTCVGYGSEGGKPVS